MRLFRDVLLEVAHQQFDFEEGQGLAARKVDQDGLSFLEEGALVQQRAGKRVAQRLGGTVLAIRDAGAEEAAGAGGAQRGHQVVEAHVDESGADNEADHRLDGFGDHPVGGGKGLVDALLCKHQLAHAVVVEGDQCVGKDGELVEGCFRLVTAAAAFEKEWHGCEDDDESALFTGDPGDDGCGSGAGSPAEAGTKEDDALALERGSYCGLRLEHRLLAQLRVAPGPEAFGEVHAELDLFLGKAC